MSTVRLLPLRFPTHLLVLRQSLLQKEAVVISLGLLPPPLVWPPLLNRPLPIVIDVNNANVRVYLKMPGLYPNLAGKIVSNGPYNSVGDLYNIPGLTGKDKELLKKYENRFVAQKPSADYVIDRINNGL